MRLLATSALAIALVMVAVALDAPASAQSKELRFDEAPTGWTVTPGTASDVGTIRAKGVNKRLVRYSISGHDAFSIHRSKAEVSYDGSAIDASSVDLTITARHKNDRSNTASITVSVAVDAGDPTPAVQQNQPDGQPATQAPVSGPVSVYSSKIVWRAVLTVDRTTTGTNHINGCSGDGDLQLDNCSNLSVLSEDEFTYEGTTYRFRTIYWDKDGAKLVVGFVPPHNTAAGALKAKGALRHLTLYAEGHPTNSSYLEGKALNIRDFEASSVPGAIELSYGPNIWWYDGMKVNLRLERKDWPVVSSKSRHVIQLCEWGIDHSHYRGHPHYNRRNHSHDGVVCWIRDPHPDSLGYVVDLSEKRANELLSKIKQCNRAVSTKVADQAAQRERCAKLKSGEFFDRNNRPSP